MNTILIIIFFLVCLVICISFSLLSCSIAKKKDRIFYKISEFRAMDYLHRELLSNHQYIDNFSRNILKIKPKTDYKRVAGVWTGQEADRLMEEIGDHWLYGPTSDDKWLNYLLIANGEFKDYVKDPKLKEILNPIKGSIYICGLSFLKPGGKIKPHEDTDTTYNKGRLAYHYNIYGNGSKLTVNDITVNQIPMNSLIFDSGFTHSVNNGEEERMIIYIDFFVDKARRHPAKY